MKSSLEELFYGHIFPFERIVPQDPEYRPLNQKNPISSKEGGVKSLPLPQIRKTSASKNSF